MIIADISRLLSGPMGSMVSSLAGPKALVIAAAGFVLMFGYIKYQAKSNDVLAVENQSHRLESERIEQLNASLDRALEKVATLSSIRVETEVTSQRNQRQADDTVDSTLDLPIPPAVLGILRNNQTNANAGAGDGT